jgi:hypothetical protein
VRGPGNVAAILFMMIRDFKSIAGRFAATAVIGLWFASGVRATDALFIGNSFTYGGPDKVVNEAHGGVPRLVEAIAASKGKSLATVMLTSPGKDFAYHLNQAKTGEDLNLKKWDWVVLQGFSLEATHAGDRGSFLTNGEIFYRRIRTGSPHATIVLYETWAWEKRSDLFNGDATKKFTDPDQMDREVQEGYQQLYRKLEAIDPSRQIELAPVGLAFERCREEYPDIALHDPDHHHANTQGSYLAALVIYATMFHDNPEGATRNVFGTELDSTIATRLQTIARKVTGERKKAEGRK